MSMLKAIAFAIFCFIAVVSNAATMTVAPLPPSEYADTEVSTNVCLDVTQVLAEEDNYRSPDVALSLDATCANSDDVIQEVWCCMQDVLIELSQDECNPEYVLDRGFKDQATEAQLALAAVVSNNLDHVFASFGLCATSQIERLVLLHAGWAYDDRYYLNFYGRLLDKSFEGHLPFEELRWYNSAHRNPIRLNCLAINYDQPGVSNIVLRYQCVSGRTNYCERVLSGAAKAEFMALYNEMMTPKR